MSLVPEEWEVILRDGDEVIITRILHEDRDRLTTWRLKRAIVTRDCRPVQDWRITDIFFSQVNEGEDGKPTRLKDYGKGIRLSDNLIDRTLRELANAV